MRSTSGGKGGETVIVSTLAALESAVAGNDPRIVVVSGTISGAKKVLVGSNKSIIGRGGSENYLIHRALAVLLLTGRRNCRHWPLSCKCD